jgi:hypothetical protein
MTIVLIASSAKAGGAVLLILIRKDRHHFGGSGSTFQGLGPSSELISTHGKTKLYLLQKISTYCRKQVLNIKILLTLTRKIEQCKLVLL